MRIDKYLKVSRLIKRRTVAANACDAGRVMINEKIVSPSAKVKVGDKITINMGSRPINVEVIQIIESTKKEDAPLMYKEVEA